jgi:HPr kinase/phosphorylase
MLLHASCAARVADAVLFLGPPGCGKSDLVLRLLDRGWHLVADDQVSLGADLAPEPPPALAGMLEVRGLGLFSDLPRASPPVTLRLVVELAADRATIPRLPAPRRWSAPGVTSPGSSLPSVSLWPVEAAATAKVEWALDAALGLRAQHAGAFA